MDINNSNYITFIGVKNYKKCFSLNTYVRFKNSQFKEYILMNISMADFILYYYQDCNFFSIFEYLNEYPSRSIILL